MRAGADWTHFNAEQTVARRNMQQLYGNKKWLFDRKQVYSAASRHALPSLFGIQVLIYPLSASKCSAVCTIKCNWCRIEHERLGSATQFGAETASVYTVGYASPCTY